MTGYARTRIDKAVEFLDEARRYVHDGLYRGADAYLQSARDTLLEIVPDLEAETRTISGVRRACGCTELLGRYDHGDAHLDEIPLGRVKVMLDLHASEHVCPICRVMIQQATT